MVSITGTHRMGPFNRHDRVVLVHGHGLDQAKSSNPVFDPNYSTVYGVIKNIDSMRGGLVYMLVQFDNGAKNMFRLDDGSCSFIPAQDVHRYMGTSGTQNKDETMAAKKKSKVVKVDATKLEALVLDQAIKDEIVSVLMQYEKGDALFTDWGLGETIEYGKAMGLMFHGMPGTGKTWGAHCIAKALGLELLVISASEIQSSEPGGANRNIEEAFKAAKEGNKVLFLDECDSLIWNRADLGMILGSEVNTLLTQIEKFEGVVILATNRIEHMDEALERRISLIVEFPFPDAAARESIWKRMIPKKLPLASDVDVVALSQELLSGGQIKNAILQASRLAIGKEQKEVTLQNFKTAIDRMKKSQGLMGRTARNGFNTRHSGSRGDVNMGQSISSGKPNFHKFLQDQDKNDEQS